MSITESYLSKIKKDDLKGPRGFPGVAGTGTGTGVSLGETSTTAYRGDRGKTAYDHSQESHAPASAEQNVNADWNAVTGDSVILNKPAIPTVSDTAYDDTSWDSNTDVPTKNAVRDKIVSIDSAISGKAAALGLDDNYVTDAEKVVIGNTSGTNSGDNAVNSNYSGLAASKQDTLQSGVNIKTVNSNSLLGSGNILVTANPYNSNVLGSDLTVPENNSMFMSCYYEVSDTFTYELADTACITIY